MVRTKFESVTHLIFDMDGLLLDTEGIYKTVISAIAQKYGKVYTNEVRFKLLGTTEMDTAKIAVKEMNLPITPEEFHKQFSVLSQTALKNCSFSPGAEKLIRHLSKHKIPIAVGTSSSKEHVAIKTTNHQEVFSLFHHIVMSSGNPEVKRGKPYPDVFQICASKFPDNPSPEKVLVFEDAPNGTKAAAAAGMQCVMVPDPHINDELCKFATVVLRSLEDFEPKLFGLPPYISTG